MFLNILRILASKVLKMSKGRVGGGGSNGSPKGFSDLKCEAFKQSK